MQKENMKSGLVYMELHYGPHCSVHDIVVNKEILGVLDWHFSLWSYLKVVQSPM